MDLLIAERKYSLNDQLDFAVFSGDRNPIHIDPVYARRTLNGQCIVHGVHALIWALDSLAFVKNLVAVKMNVKFLKPIFLEQVVLCFWDADHKRLLLKSNDLVLASINIEIGEIDVDNILDVEHHPSRICPHELSFNQCLEKSESQFKVFGDITLGDKLFPHFVRAYGVNVTAEIGATSQVVGMECPGLHSLFASLCINLNTIRPKTHKSSYLVGGDSRFNLLNLLIKSGSMTAEIEAFYRPAPVTNPHISEVAENVVCDEFLNVRALIVGGSRGLGELMAKIIAAGGGYPIVTYHVGLSDATKLREEIILFGGKCEIAQLTVDKCTTIPVGYVFNQLYYFATPKILGRRLKNFDNVLYRIYHGIYVDAFASICKDLIAQKHNCSIFYPSTVFAQSPPLEYEEYALAKIEGENLCTSLNKNGSLEIISKRLPRLATDQNQAIFEEKLQSSIDLLIPLARQMRASQVISNGIPS